MKTQSASSLPAADFYVATNGNNTWSGTLPEPNKAGTDGPFATLTRARDALRSKRQRGAIEKTGVVMVRNGYYSLSEPLFLDAHDSGTPRIPMLYRACPGETVILSGGVTLPPEAFSPVRDEAIRDRLDATVRNRVLQADLTALGITRLGSFPIKFRGAPKAPELFYNDKPMQLARWPDSGWATIAHIIDTGACPRQGDTSQKPGVFEYHGDRPSHWRVDDGIWLRGYYCYDWYAEAIKVRAIDAAHRRITFDAPAQYSLRQGNPSPRRYYALNVLEELTRPGEYYIDRKQGRLFFLPPGDIEAARIVLSTLDGPVVLLKDTANITLRGFTVEATLADGIDIRGGSDNRIEACEIRNVRAVGISVSGGERHRVEACDVHDTGTGGITLSGGNRKTLTPAGHEAVNNHVWRFSRNQLTYANAFLISGVGNRVAHNLIHDAPHQAIGISGNDHIFEYNIVHHVCTETDDCGAYYKGRNPSCRGNIVRYNFWHHIGSPMGHGNAAVYFDDGDGGDTVFGNVFFRCGDPGKGSFGTVFSHGGHDILAENNIFVECKRALGSAPWNDKRWAAALQWKLWKTRLLQEVDITKPPYTTHYPELVGFMTPAPGQPRINIARNNVIVMGADVKSGNWQVDPSENWITNRDPGFVDAARGDFRLRSDSEVFRRLPHFTPIPFEKIGLYADALRPHPPTEAWPYEPLAPLLPLVQKPKTTTLPPKTGPRPVFAVPRRTKPKVIDGIIDPAEWADARPAHTMLLAQDVSGRQAKPTSRAWLVADAEGLTIAVDNTVDPHSDLKGNQWGGDDALEISLRPDQGGKSQPIAVVRGYPNGFLRFGLAANGKQEPASAEPGPIRYKARILAPDHWTAEIFIPYTTFDCRPGIDNRIAANLTVRKAHDNLWLMWEGTRAHSYDVGRAGILELAP